MENTINQVFKNRADKYQDRTAIEKKLRGVWESASWKEYYERARAIGLGLYELGVRKGDRVSILCDNRLEWLYTDMGTLGIGAVLIPIYTTLTDEEAEFIIGNSESKIFIVENKNQAEKAVHCVNKCACLEKVVVIEDFELYKDNPKFMSYAHLIEQGRKFHDKNPKLFEDIANGITQEDLATLVYTSGTTGVPKGAMISHKNIMAVVNALHKVEPHYADDSDQTVPFLPLSHVFERIAGHFYGMYVGITCSYAESIDTLLNDFLEKRPTVILAVPRVCEKVYQKIISQVEESSWLKRKVFYWGQKVGATFSMCREENRPVPLIPRLKYKIAYKIIFSKLMEKLGGRVRWMTASGAPTAREIIQFFNAAGIMVIQGYGMTETTAPATMQSIADYRIGTTGRPIPCCEIKIAEDGEILIKGDNVVSGYWRMPEETAEAFTSDGYLMSGDIGIFDEKGFLLITDRKKDLIITSGGKNVAPQKIENLFKSDPLFTQFVVVGERKKYLAALCNINLDLATKIADEKGIAYGSPEELLENPKFHEVINSHFTELNRHLARYETIKKWRIVKVEFSQATGELTPSLKVKRKVIFEKYKELIESMYQKEASDDLAEHKQYDS
jgi:long-chain acyl-CoA synthetase